MDEEMNEEIKIYRRAEILVTQLQFCGTLLHRHIILIIYNEKK